MFSSRYDLNSEPLTIQTMPPKNRRVGRPKKEDKFEFKAVYASQLPLTEAKWKDLQYMCKEGVIPSKYHEFYEKLESTNSFINSSKESD